MCVIKTLAVNLWVESMETKQNRSVFPFHFGCDLGYRHSWPLQELEIWEPGREMHTAAFRSWNYSRSVGSGQLCALFSFPIKSACWRIIDPRAPCACQAALGRPHHFLFCLEIQPGLSAQTRGPQLFSLLCNEGRVALLAVRSASVIKEGRWR